MRKTFLFTILLFLLISKLDAIKINKENPLIILDFDNKKSDVNIYGYKSFAKNLTPDYPRVRCSVKYIKDIDLHKKGKYLKFEYDVSADNSKVAYVIPFHGLDLTYFKKISFYIKGKASDRITEKIKIKIQIDTWNSSKVILIDDIISRWKKIEINLNSFILQNSDYFNDEGVEKISFVVDNLTGGATRGVLFFDDIKLIPYNKVNISLKELKMSKYMKPRKRLRGFPEDKTKKVNLSIKSKKLLLRIAQDTWLFFKNVIDKDTYLVMDNITVSKNIKASKIADYTNITNIGLQILSILAAYDMRFITKGYAISYIKKMVKTLKELKRWHGLFYNYYLTKNGHIANRFISSVDNGWLAAGLICLRNSFNKEFYDIASRILNNMDFSKLYNSKLGQLSLGYDVKTGKYSQYNYGLIYTEPRITSLIGIGKGDIPIEHWFRVYRTLPKEWNWQRQKPQGRIKKMFGVKFFGGYYTYEGIKFVPSWGGSMFEALMPLIVLDELKWMPQSFGKNDKRMVQLTIKYAEEKGFKYWGFSPCSVPDSVGGYREFGIPVLGVKGYDTDDFITPHAIILAFMAKYNENKVMKNLKQLLKDFPDIYGQYGFYDSVNIRNGRITKKYLSLDQSMILLSICNYINNGSIRKKFENDDVFKEVKDILSKENFFD